MTLRYVDKSPGFVRVKYETPEDADRLKRQLESGTLGDGSRVLAWTRSMFDEDNNSVSVTVRDDERDVVDINVLQDGKTRSFLT